MIAIAAAAVLLKPAKKAPSSTPQFSLELIVPKRFGEWHERTQIGTRVVNPQTQELLDKLYSQVLTRTYVNGDGYVIMLSIAYGDDQRGSLQAHKPEVCYPAQGFKLVRSEAAAVPTAFGDIPAQRLFTTFGQRIEPVTYWFASGSTVVKSKFAKRLVDMRFALTGEVPDGLIFRISSLDGDQARANRMHDQFVDQLMRLVSPENRKRLSGLEDVTLPTTPG